MPGPAARDGFPQVGEKRGIVVAGIEDAVVLSDQLFARVAADDAEQIVDQCDIAGKVGFGHAGCAVECFLLFAEGGKQPFQGHAHGIECACRFLQLGWAAGTDGDAHAVVPGLDPAGGCAQSGQIFQIDSQHDMDQPAQQAHREAEQDEQPGPEMPQKIFIGVGRRLDAQTADVDAIEDQIFPHDGKRQMHQPGKPVGTIRRG